MVTPQGLTSMPLLQANASLTEQPDVISTQETKTASSSSAAAPQAPLFQDTKTTVRCSRLRLFSRRLRCSLDDRMPIRSLRSRLLSYTEGGIIGDKTSDTSKHVPQERGRDNFGGWVLVSRYLLKRRVIERQEEKQYLRDVLLLQPLQSHCLERSYWIGYK